MEKFQDNQRLQHLTGPAVIIAGSGMCTGDSIVNHLKHSLGHRERPHPGQSRYPKTILLQGVKPYDFCM